MNTLAKRISATALLLCAPFAVGQSKSGNPQPKPDTIEGFKKLGAIYGGFVEGPFGDTQFVKGKKAALKGLPAFRFRDFDAGKLPKLPEVATPIGIDFFLSLANDADLKQLKSLKKLTALNLGFTNIGDAGLKELKSHTNLATLHIHRTKITDKGLIELTPFKNLKALDLEGTKITDAGLKELTRFKGLKVLDLDVTNVTDKGVKDLTQMKNLTALHIGLTKITDKGLKELQTLKSLDHLNILGTSVSVGGINEFRKALPKCKIIH